MKKKNIDIFSYLDYRAYLKDYFNEQKAANRKFSYRVFARRAGYNSSGLLIDVIKGRSNIQNSVILKFARGIGLKKKETVFFENLVYFNQSDSIQEKSHYFKLMTPLLTKAARRVLAGQYLFYSTWYFPAVLNLLNWMNFKNDYKAIARTLMPHITSLDARRTIKMLAKFGFIKKEASGFYRPAASGTNPDRELKGFNEQNLQAAMLVLANEARSRFSAEQRQLTTLTFSADRDSFRKIKSELEALPEKINALLPSPEKADCVCQLNLQFFPLTEIKESP